MPGESPLPGSVSGITGIPASQTAGRSFTVNVYATDDYWNQVPSGDAVPARVIDRSRRHARQRRALCRLPPALVHADDHRNPDGDGNGSDQLAPSLPMTSAGIQVVPSAANNFAFSAIASPQVAGVPFTVTIRAVDASGNTGLRLLG